jgi:hypothetical protein
MCTKFYSENLKERTTRKAEVQMEDNIKMNIKKRLEFELDSSGSV